VGDADVIKCLRMLTFLPLEQIDEMAGWEGSELNRAKEILAWELTALVHGEEEADKARDTSRSLFAGSGSQEDAPEVVLEASELENDSITLPALLVRAELCKSRSEARTNIIQGGVSIDGVAEKDFNRSFSVDELRKGILLRRGKKNYKKIVLK
jgi:tyrosyl-tRNA synthetase